MITEEDPPASGATRVDQPWSVGAGQPGDSNRPAETAEATCQTGTSTENLAMNARAAAVTAATASAHAGPGRAGQHRIRRQRPAPQGEHHPDLLDASAEAPQPAAHRPGRAPAARRSGDARHQQPSPRAPPRSPRPCPRA